MSVIGEAALSAFFEVLFDNLSSSDLLKIFQQEQVHADLKKWKTTLPKIRAVLDDAEDKQMTSKFVKSWRMTWKTWLMMWTTSWTSLLLKLCDVS